ncbi:MAG: TIGR00282 family metallophosphoesterase [Nitrospirota bacterium]
MKIFFIGDIVGEAGRKAVSQWLDKIIDRYNIDLVIANGENAAGGFGLTSKIIEDLFSQGIHVITTGNHVWDKKELISCIANEKRLLRPANYPDGVPGNGSAVIETSLGEKAVIINLMGRVFMLPIDCPFRKAEEKITELKAITPVIIVDFHAEATSEKVAMGWHLDGKVSAVIGTHTHIQTADEKILPRGTAYITDIGMTGPAYSVIGIKKDMIIDKFLTFMPKRFEMAKGPVQLEGVVFEVDSKTGKALNLQRIQLKSE